MKYTKYKYSLLELIEKLHMFTTGSYDCDYLYALDISFEIEDRLRNWKESMKSPEYDLMIYNLCKLVLEEFNDNN